MHLCVCVCEEEEEEEEEGRENVPPTGDGG